jgi:UDP-GlcNAc3NAcA epimerase
MKVITVVGARPQFIKAASVSRAIQAFNRKHSRRRIQEILVHTGQHYDYLMDRVFFEELQLPKPNYHLGIGSGSHGKQTGIMLERIETVLQKEKPEWVMVYGDTNSTLAGALSAAKLNIPVAHVEAGLRSYNRIMPEEINRLLTDHLSTLLFCPTRQAVRNLAREGIKNEGRRMVKRVGDVMYDSVLYYSNQAEEKSTIFKELNLFSPDDIYTPNSKLKTQNSGLLTPNYFLATLHRAENTDDPRRLRSILRALDEIGKDTLVILPLHPRTKKMMETYHLFSFSRRIKLIEPISYLDMLTLEKDAKAILTDSGGVQKEAYWFRVPCFTLRDETEWVETVKRGWNVLVGTEKGKILSEVRKLKFKKDRGRVTADEGGGRASERIVEILAAYGLR